MIRHGRRENHPRAAVAGRSTLAAASAIPGSSSLGSQPFAPCKLLVQVADGWGGELDGTRWIGRSSWDPVLPFFCCVSLQEEVEWR
jgi:hypothetical protein